MAGPEPRIALPPDPGRRRGCRLASRPRAPHRNMFSKNTPNSSNRGLHIHHVFPRPPNPSRLILSGPNTSRPSRSAAPLRYRLADQPLDTSVHELPAANTRRRAGAGIGLSPRAGRPTFALAFRRPSLSSPSHDTADPQRSNSSIVDAGLLPGLPDGGGAGASLARRRWALSWTGHTLAATTALTWSR